MTLDHLALAIKCSDGRSVYARVDDLVDEDEAELSDEEIHVSLMATDGPEELVFCFRLSTTSATALINELCAAVARRRDGEPWSR